MSERKISYLLKIHNPTTEQMKDRKYNNVPARDLKSEETSIADNSYNKIKVNKLFTYLKKHPEVEAELRRNKMM